MMHIAKMHSEFWYIMLSENVLNCTDHNYTEQNWKSGTLQTSYVPNVRFFQISEPFKIVQFKLTIKKFKDKN